MDDGTAETNSDLSVWTKVKHRDDEYAVGTFYIALLVIAYPAVVISIDESTWPEGVSARVWPDCVRLVGYLEKAGSDIVPSIEYGESHRLWRHGNNVDAYRDGWVLFEGPDYDEDTPENKTLVYERKVVGDWPLDYNPYYHDAVVYIDDIPESMGKALILAQILNRG